MTEGSLLPEKSHGQSKTIDRGLYLDFPLETLWVEGDGFRGGRPWLPAPNGDGKPQRMIQ
jgi:hypothetical protein